MCNIFYFTKIISVSLMLGDANVSLAELVYAVICLQDATLTLTSKPIHMLIRMRNTHGDKKRLRDGNRATERALRRADVSPTLIAMPESRKSTASNLPRRFRVVTTHHTRLQVPQILCGLSRYGIYQDYPLCDSYLLQRRPNVWILPLKQALQAPACSC